MSTHSVFYVLDGLVVKILYPRLHLTNIHELTKVQDFVVLFAAMGFYLNINCITTVIHIQISKSDVGTPGAIGYTKANRNIIGIIKYTPQNIRNILVTHAERNALKKRLRQTHDHTFRNPEILMSCLQ